MRHIRQIEPGSMTSYARGAETSRRFWQPRRRGGPGNLEEAAEAFVPLFDRVVGDQLISDVPVGILQSGGIDSSLIAHTVAKKGKFPLYTASFAERSHDETAIAGMVSGQTGLPHRIVPISSDSNPEQTLADIVRHFDGQVADESAGPLFLLTREIRRSSTVALSGDGADEFFGGYSTYRASRLAEMIGPMIPNGLARAVGKFTYSASGADESRLPVTALLSRFLLGIASGNAHAHAEWRRCLPDFLVPDLYGPALRDVMGQSPMADYGTAIDTADGRTLLDRCLIADQAYHLPSGLLMKTDAMSMANSVEIRVPFLDRRIMEFSANCDLGLLLPARGPSKPLLRAALRKKGASADVWSAPKRGFNNPLAELIRGPLRPLCTRIFEGAPGILEPYLRPDAVRRIWRSHAARQCNHAYALWPILTFALWRSQLEGHPIGGVRQETAA